MVETALWLKTVVFVQAVFNAKSASILGVTLLPQQGFGNYYPLLHWLPLWMRLPLPRPIIAIAVKKSVKDKNFFVWMQACHNCFVKKPKIFENVKIVHAEGNFQKSLTLACQHHDT